MPIRKSVKKSSVRRVATENHEKMVPFGRAVANFFKKYFQFSGVATRAEYWWATLFVILVFVGVMALAIWVQPMSPLIAALLALIWFVFCFAIIVPMWSVASRRLHDAGYSAKLLLISLVFFVYSMLVPKFITPGATIVSIVDWLSFFWGVIMLVLFIMPSKKQGNPYRD